MQIRLPVRFYRAVPTSNPQGYVQEEWVLKPEETAFIELHCWNVGCEGGTPVPEEFWVDMGSPRNHELADCIIKEQIVPAMDAARRMKMSIVHVQPEGIGDRYSQQQPPIPKAPPQPSNACVSDHSARRAERVHGEGFLHWEGWQHLDVAPLVRPREGDTMIVTTGQFDSWLRSRGITTLIYTGFSTNLCILNSPAAMKAMAGFGYKCVILREATLAVEFPDTIEERLNTRVALRYIETWVGYTASGKDFIEAAKLNANG